LARGKAATLAAHREALEAALPHQLDLVTRHRPLRVRLVIGGRRRFRALLWVAVQEQQRRAATAVPDPERRLADVDALELEAGEERRHRYILCEKIACVFAPTGS
jgi:hypothetical protein